MTAQEDTFMRRAIALAVGNARSGRGGPFGAVVVSQGQMIAEGTNLVTSANDPTAHAEVVAIRAACSALGRFQIGDCEIYTSCEPCPMCLGAIYWARVGKLYFAATRHDAAAAGFDDSLIYQQIGLAPAERRIPTAQWLGEEAREPFHAWLAKPDKVPY